MSINGVALGLHEIAKMAGNEESITLDEVIPESRRPPTRDTKYHGPSRIPDHEIESAKWVKDGEKADDET